MRPIVLAALLGVFATPALAASACAPPAGLTPAPTLTPRAEEVVTGIPIAAYVLALNWTPQWCRSGGAGATAKEMECAAPHGFTLHGLWPDGARPPYPRFCRPGGQLDATTVRQMYCRTPSPVLLQHEWQAHGTCTHWPDAKAYFAQAARLYDALKIPRIEHLGGGQFDAGALRAAFVAANPALRANEIFVQTNHGGDLTEVRVCYDLAFHPTACLGGNGAPDHVRLQVAPSRTGAF